MKNLILQQTTWKGVRERITEYDWGQARQTSTSPDEEMIRAANDIDAIAKRFVANDETVATHSESIRTTRMH